MNKFETWFEEIRLLGWKPGLSRVKELLRRFDNPQNKLDIIHISGSNGKGSTATLLANILSDSGYKTGQFSTPSILGFNHMFLIDKLPVDDQTLNDIIERIRRNIEEMISDGFEHPTEYEIIAGIMYIYFCEKHVDFAVVEVAMGGEKDCTNVMDHSILSIMTPISMDHSDFLGASLHAIASEKSGIVKENSVLITHPQKTEVMKVLEEVCDCKMSVLKSFDIDLSIDYADELMTFEYDGLHIESHLLGHHQAMNIIHVIESIRNLNIRGYIQVNGQDLIESIRATSFPGRFEILGNYILDGAHNHESLLALRDTLELLNLRDLTGVIGVLKDKDILQGLKALKPFLKGIYVTEPRNPRKLDAYTLENQLRSMGYDILGRGKLEDIFKSIKGERILAFGSFYMIAEFRKEII